MKTDTIWTPHDHKCANPSCKTVWFHDPIDVIRLKMEGRDEEAETLNETSHRCPTCETENYYIADGDDKPQYLKDGKRCIPIADRIPTVDTLETHTAREELRIHMKHMRLMDMLAAMGVKHG